MSASDHKLSERPADARERELWLQHAAGFILFRDMREYALRQIDSSLSGEARIAAEKGIDDAVYGLMMILDGVTGGLANDSQQIRFRGIVELIGDHSDEPIEVMDLFDGDGMCMGYHWWRDNDFGKNPPFHAT